MKELFIQANCFLIDRKLVELDIPQPIGTKARVFIPIINIEGVRETTNDELNGLEIDPNSCMVFLKSGDSLLVDKPFPIIKEQLKLYYENT